jgi:hypothetical protein
MSLYVRLEREPPGEPRESPWPDDGDQEPGEPPGEPREEPWPDAPASEPPGEPQETPWDEP